MANLRPFFSRAIQSCAYSRAQDGLTFAEIVFNRQDAKNAKIEYRIVA
jgi:hypothetical protein